MRNYEKKQNRDARQRQPRPSTTTASRVGKNNFNDIVSMMSNIQQMNNGYNLLGAQSTQNTAFRTKNNVFEKAEAHIVEQILKKHSKVDVELVKEITAKEVAGALAVRKLIGAKQLSDLEDKIYGKVMF